jgi:septum formation topological specificity factor MinE
LESEYATPDMTKPDLEQIKNELIKVIEEYVEELKDE